MEELADCIQLICTVKKMPAADKAKTVKAAADKFVRLFVGAFSGAACTLYVHVLKARLVEAF